ncbi:hypothetical protein BXZ70DRAFT_962032 [Cristinia sonorae]|uniref:Myosin-binding domain-containing protein n=1 Tax=Cristinia sonorae TaxID=1940300 RepID=A0A8K0XJZ0_9AGAR|nr:hypothetical protein BXZ70DRAFT_962032 [Cristinia sonorae]
MAQPVFDEHPLEEYFRQTGEIAEDMPGTHMDLPAETSQVVEGDTERGLEIIPDFFKSPEFLYRVRQVLNLFLSSSSPDNQFAERFKYDVISSSLLSSNLSGTPRRGTTPSRLPSEPIIPPSQTSLDEEDREGPTQWDSLRIPTAMVSVAIVAVSAEYYFVSLFLLAAALSLYQMAKSRASRAVSVNLTVTALNELISAGNVWDSAVNEAMAIVEKEERRPNSFYGPTSPHSPFSSLRVTLQSSLHTTQNQCDNVRQLLTALTSPAQASQLSEMYAPSSPTAPSFLQLEQLHSRPMSDPVANWRKRTTSLPYEQPYNKRATWNGSYVALAQASNPLLSIKRAEKRRSDLSMLFTSPPAKHPSMSAPSTPHPLGDVQEEDNDDDEDNTPHIPELPGEYFGMAALDLRRKRQSAGLSALKATRPMSYSMKASRSLPGPAPLISSASRFTLPQTSRNPLSLAALRLALRGALSAKRYTSSHLLALRFEDDDDTYWEDVRSIMALLTSTFSDASSRLTEALDENERKRVKEECADLSDIPREVPPTPSKSMQEMVGFAPMPSHMARFAAHVDAISTALDDARTHLEQTVASLRDPLKQTVSSDPFVDSPPAVIPPTESPVLQAYDRLRKEIGFALRECERGREHLLNTIMPPSSNTANLTDGEDEGDAAPSLIPDTATSDGGASASSLPAPATILSVPEPGNGLGLGMNVDDVTEHLLMSASAQHLPPPGVDQVYEAESGTFGVFTRERSKMSREERIRLSKEKRRESGGRGALAFIGENVGEAEGGHVRKWSSGFGPEGEVVQELKDVIWKVSEKKRRMSEQAGASKRAAPVVSRPHSISPLPRGVDAEIVGDVDLAVNIESPTPTKIVNSETFGTSWDVDASQTTKPEPLFSLPSLSIPEPEDAEDSSLLAYLS